MFIYTVISTHTHVMKAMEVEQYNILHEYGTVGLDYLQQSSPKI